jgi:hypothetical protein
MSKIRTGVAIAALMMITAPAMARPPNMTQGPMAGPYGAPAAWRSRGFRAVWASYVASLPSHKRPGDEAGKAGDLPGFGEDDAGGGQVAAAVQFRDPRHRFGEGRRGVRAPRRHSRQSAYPMRGGAWGFAMKTNKLTALAQAIVTLRLRYLTWKLRALCWVLRRVRAGAPRLACAGRSE